MCCRLIFMLILIIDLVVKQLSVGLSRRMKVSDDIHILLTEYRNMHSADVIGREYASQLCQRKFVFATFRSDSSVGNQLGPFLNNFAVAVITNRTLIVEDHSHKDLLFLHDWVIREKSLTEKLKLANCTFKSNSRHFLNNYKCCDIDSVNESVISTPSLGNTAFDELHPLSGSILNLFSQKQSKILFSNSYGFGRYEAYLLPFHSVLYHVEFPALMCMN